MKVVSLMMSVIFIFLTFSFITTTKTEAAPNYQINYQGKLTNASNVAVADGTYNMRFWLLTSGSIATTSALWNESLTGANKVQVTNGLFSIMLGSTSPLTGVDFNQTLYLGVEIGGTSSPIWDGEMSPRKTLGTVPSAFEADKIDGLTSTQFVRTDATTTIATSSTDTLLTITQNGVGDILNLFDGTTEVFTVVDGGNVGLGTTSPSRKLTVQGGDGWFGGNLTATGTATFANLLVSGSSTIGDGTATGGLTINGNATTTNLKVTSLTASRAIFTDTNNLLTTTGVSQYLIDSLSDETGTGFAVFSASPTFTGTARFSSLIATASSTIGDGTGAGGLTINGNATSTLGLIMSGTNSNITLGSNYLSGDGGDEGIFVDASGNVGIGTTTPYARLTIAGAGIADYFTAVSTTSTTTLAGSLNVGDGAITYDYASGLTTIQNMAFGAMNFDSDAGIVTWVDMPVTSASATGTMMSYSANIAGTSTLTVYAESAGNGGAQNFRVGIGSSTPTRTLTVSGDGWFTGNITAASSTLGYASSTSFTTGSLRATASSTIGDGTGAGGLTVSGTATTTNLKITSLSDGCLNVTSGLVSSTGSACGSGSGGSSNWLFDGTRLTPSTTVGIGIFASSTIGDGTATGGLTINGTATSTLGLIMSGTNSNITLGSNYLSGDGGDEGIFVDASGNVGIGTTTPSSQLTIANFSASNTSRPFFDITASTTDGSNSSYQNSFFRISYASSTEIFGKVIDPEFISEEQGPTPGTSLNGASSVFVSGNYAYVSNFSRDSLSIIDISNPADPVFVSEEVQVTSLDGVSSVFVSGNYAYVANDNRASLAVIDISNPADPVFISEERGPTPGTSLNRAHSVFVSGNYAYVANLTRDSLAVIDISNPADPVFISEERGPTPGTSLDNASSVFVSGNYAYMANNIRDSLAVIDISNSADPVFISEERGPTPGTSLNGAWSVFVSGNYAYVANYDGASLAVIDISNPADPVFISEERGPTPGTSLFGAYSVFVSGNYAYMANEGHDSLAVIDISNPADPVFISEERGPTPGTSLNGAQSVFVSGNYAYVANATRDSIAVIDVGGATVSNLAVGTAKIGNLQVDSFAQFAQGALFGGSLGVQGNIFANGGGSFMRMGTTTPLASSTLSWGNTPTTPALSALIIDGASSGVSDVFSLSHLATSTSASAGIGTGILFNSSIVDGATTTATTTSRIASILTNVSAATPQSVLTFANKNTSGILTEFMRLDHLGNLGLGTTSPSRKLTIQGGDAYIGGNLTATGTATFANLLVSGSSTIGGGTGSTGLTINGTATSTLGLIMSGTNSNITLGSNYLSGDGGDEGIFVDVFGNVIIGSTTANDDFTVEGTTAVRSPNANTDNLFTVKTNTGVNILELNYKASSPILVLSDESSATNDLFQLLDINNIVQGVFTDIGNLGLGTTSPSRKLTVQGGDGWFGGNLTATGTATFANLLVSGSSTIGGGTGSTGLTINGTATSTLGLIMSGTNSNITLGSNYLSGDGGDEGIYVDASGNVGIGTTTPSSRLTIQGTAGATASLLRTASSTDTTTFEVLASGDVEVPNNLISKGITWTARSAAEANGWTSITYGNGLFVAVPTNGGTGEFQISSDGIIWATTTASAGNVWTSITYGNGLFVAVAQSGTNRVRTSPDGNTWTYRSSAQANTWNSVTYGNGLFVAVAESGTNRVMTSPDGITWTARSASQANTWNSVTYGNGLFVAVSATTSTSTAVMTSPDGITWTARSASQANTWNSVTYGNGLFVAVAGSGTNRVMTSPDGITWTARSASQANAWNSVTYGNGLFVAVAWSGTNRVMTSPDGITWTARSASEANLWYSVTYGNGLFVAVAGSGTNRVMTSGKSEFNQIATNNIYQGGMSILGGVFNIGTTTGTTSPYASNILNIASTSGSSLFTITSAGNVGIGTTSPTALLTIDKAGVSGSAVAGMKQYFGFINSVASALYYGDETYIVNAPTATSTLVGKMIRIEDSTALGNVVRGFEAQAHRGTNTKGENTGLSGFGRTFGVRGTTIGDAGDTFLPAGVFAESQGTTQGNALRAYSGTMTTEDLVSLFHDGSAFTGTGLQMNFGNTTGSFAATSTAKFLDLQVAGTSKFIISANGSTTLGDGTVNASLMIPRGGICVDNDGSCISTTTGEIRSVTSVLGNSDLAEIYFSNQALSAGEIVALSGGLSVVRASEASAENIIGVVSTKPGMTLGFDDTSLVSGESAYPIGLKGRVPIKLSTENGPIKKGDRITLSSIPGVGMKATESSRVVGMALEDYDGTRAYSVGFFNQFGDDMMKERISKKTVIDPRTQDGCYNGGGNALGEASCDPDAVKKTTITTVTDTTEYENMLTTLRNESSQMMMTEDGEEVAVGQALMFIELTNYQIATEASVLKELISTSTLTQENGTDTLWSRLKSLAQNFVDGVLTLTGIKADRVDVQNELCIDGVCVNADDLRALLQSAQGGGGGADSAPPSGGESGVPPDGNTSENIEGETTSGENQTMESGTPSITTEGSGEGVVPPSEPSTPPPEEPPVTEEVSLPPESTAEIPTSEPLVESSVNEQSPPPQESPP